MKGNKVSDLPRRPSARRRSEDEKCCSGLANFKFPLGANLILLHELLERFSFYGTKGILTLYLNVYLGLSYSRAIIIFHIFVAVSYLMPLFGAIIADNYLGRFKTIVIFGLVYMVGHLLMPLTALQKNLPGPFIGLTILAIGTGIIKPCVAAFGGDQIQASKTAKLDAFFSVFYATINIGSFVSQLITPVLRTDVKCIDDACYPLAFGVPAIAFGITYAIFLAGKPVYKITNAEGNIVSKFFNCYRYAVGRWFRERKTLNKEELLDYADDKFEPQFIRDSKVALSVIVLFTPFPIFWALYDQQSSRWVLQANVMDGTLFPNFTWKPDMMQAVNPFLICLFIPLFQTVIYPLLDKCNLLKTPPSRIVAGYFFAAFSFICSGCIQIAIDKGMPPLVPIGQSSIRLASLANCTVNASIDTGLPITLNQFNEGQLPFEITGRSGSKQLTLQPLDDCPPTMAAAIFNFNATEKQYGTLFVTSEKENIGFAYKAADVAIKGNIGQIRLLTAFSVTPNETFIAVNIRTRKNITLARPKTQHPEQFTMSNYAELPWGYYTLYMIDSDSKEEYLLGNVSITTSVVGTLGIARDINNFALVEVTELTATIISMFYQIPQYILMVMAEVLFSVTAMAYAYSESPPTMKSLLQAAYLITIFAGNMLVTFIALLPKLPNQTHVWDFFIYAVFVIIAGIVNGILAYRYNAAKTKRQKYNDFINDELYNSQGNSETRF